MNKYDMNKEFYYVYSKDLHDYLKEKGILYIIKARSIKDGGVFTMYHRTNELMNLIKTWNDMSTINENTSA
mgnify:CR=1 FL=1